MEKPTEVSKDIHQFIHSFTKHSRRIDSMPRAIDTERSPKEPWGRGKDADPCAGRRPGLCHGDSASLLHCLAFLGDVLLPWASSLNVLNSYHESGPILRHYVNNFISFLL